MKKRSSLKGVYHEKIVCYTYETFFEEVAAEEVFTYLHYDRHLFQWNNQVIENIYETTEDELKEGSTYRSKMRIEKKEMEVDITIKKMDVPNHFIAHAQTKEGVNITQYKLEERDGGTHFQVIVSLIPRNLFYWLLAQTTKWAVKFVYNDVFDAFKKYVGKRPDAERTA
ncbi:hypothetical protein JCM19046_5058 [Bacillus sp. JCM 19046]|nr:hypothetical protein JCM19046_5058 [Bacillus sp. JCM 19046]